MITLKNPSVTDNWIIDLKEYSQVENSLPMSGLNVRNDSNIVAYVDLDGLKVGEVQRYSADPFQGRNYSLIRIYNPDGQDFAPDDLFIQATKGEVVGSQPFNPQWDALFFDLDRYSAGCDSRISLCPTVLASAIKYAINTQNSIIVQRRVDVFGSANNGSFIIDFGGCDVLNSSVAKEATVTDLVQYRKTISNSELDYTETNCSIIGWVMDYLLNPNDISGDYTVESSHGDEANCYDDNMITFLYNTEQNASFVYPFEVSFSSRSLSEVHSYIKHWTTHVSYPSYLIVQLKVDGAWVTIYSNDTTGTVYEVVHETAGWDLVTGFRVGHRSNSTAAYHSRINIYDVAVFP